MKLNIKKAMTTLVLATTLILNKNNVYAESIEYVDGEYPQIPITSEINEINEVEYNMSNYFINSVPSELKRDKSFASEGITTIDKNEIVYCISSLDTDWWLVRYDNKIGYFCSDYLTPLDIYEDIDYYQVSDIIETTSKVNFRLGPNVDDKKIATINKEVQLETIAKTSNNWYLVKYDNQIGYVYGDYVTSLLDTINDLYPEAGLNEIKFEKIIYVNASSLNVRSGPTIENKKIGILSRCECVKVLKEYDEWYLIINNDGLIGYISKSFTKDINELCVVIDLSEQKLWLYNGNEVLIETDIVTGKLDTATRIGSFKIYSKQTDRYLTGEDYNAHVNYWMPFDGGIGLHDASWRKKFGGDIYLTDGSHGCVNMPKDITDDIYETISVGTKVLVHK